jgi:hypothetical protein
LPVKPLAPPRHDLVTVLEAGIFNIATPSSVDRTRGSVATVAYLPWLSGALALDAGGIIANRHLSSVTAARQQRDVNDPTRSRRQNEHCRPCR